MTTSSKKLQLDWKLPVTDIIAISISVLTLAITAISLRRVHSRLVDIHQAVSVADGDLITIKRRQKQQ